MGCLIVKSLVFFNLEIFVVWQINIGSLVQIELQVWRIWKGIWSGNNRCGGASEDSGCVHTYTGSRSNYSPHSMICSTSSSTTISFSSGLSSCSRRRSSHRHAMLQVIRDSSDVKRLKARNLLGNLFNLEHRLCKLGSRPRICPQGWFLNLHVHAIYLSWFSSRLMFTWTCWCPLNELASLLSTDTSLATTPPTLHFDPMCLKIVANHGWSRRSSPKCLCAKGFPNLLLKELQDINDDVLVCSPALDQGLDMLIVAHKLANVCFQIAPLAPSLM